jgi:hypothetical protein
MMSIGYPPPTKFHPEAKLTTASAKAEAMKIFPTRNKFSGNGQPGDLGVIEWLHLLGHSQAACELSRAEFKDMLLICSTGKAHMLILEWSTNGETIETIYHNILTHYDNRLTPGEAKALLFQYKIPKSSSLSEAVSHIMDLAGRASSSLPPGEARTALYNLEATECLIRSLPPSAKITATNLQSQLSSKLGRPATITELNRGLNVYRTTIDSEIKSRGHVPDKEKVEKKPYKGKWLKKSATGPSTMSLQTNPPTANGQQGAQSKGPNQKNDKGKGKKFVKKGPQGSLNYCSLCGGVDHLASQGCYNMRDDKGAHVNIMPNTIKIKGEVDLNLSFSSSKTVFVNRFYVIEDIPDIPNFLIGDDFLRKYKGIVLYFSSDSIPTVIFMHPEKTISDVLYENMSETRLCRNHVNIKPYETVSLNMYLNPAAGVLRTDHVFITSLSLENVLIIPSRSDVEYCHKNKAFVVTACVKNVANKPFEGPLYGKWEIISNCDTVPLTGKNNEQILSLINHHPFSREVLHQTDTNDTLFPVHAITVG